ncbi:cytochrome P450, family 142, subfamily A, polypeptide 1 [Duganella sp. CF458]|uniref:cytochrome P450 n=1 Tax=Duganella sp. CF458 TaxID=1884368 RepID=UPI0008EE0AD0|nr:cytochrome P450 [Duganella sp. CF458]SFG37505.1 cytochrome P450, family 142, subfamily A, polypeptide 1 [Duganella sp. CF458]
MDECPLQGRARSSADLWREIGAVWADVPVQRAQDPFTGAPCVIVTGRDAIDHVARHPQLFSSAARSAMPEEYGDSALHILRRQLINMDPPQHKAHRAILARHFSEQARQRYRPHIERYAQLTVDALLGSQRCEFVAQVAGVLPFLTILHILGLPTDDHLALAPLVQQALFGTPAGKARAASELYLYALQQLQRCRSGAAVPGSLMAAMLEAEADGKPLSDGDIVSLLVFVLIAGTSSTRATIAHGMLLLIRHPAQWLRLQAQPQLLPNAVEEMLRHAPAFTCMRRTAMADTQLEGVAIGKGDKLLLCYRPAHFSAALFGPDAQAFDVARVPDAGNSHRAFGVGQHFCLGNAIARMELVALFAALTRKLSAPRLLAAPQFSDSLHLDDIDVLHIAYRTNAHGGGRLDD